MIGRIDATVDCLLVGEYVDEAECPANLSARQGEVPRTHLVAEYLDFWSEDDNFKEFTVLLKDGRVVAVRGHGLRSLPNSETGEDLHYGIVTRTADEEIIVALFKSSELVSIFHGEMRCDRKIA